MNADKEPYEKPELITEEFSTQVFLANCYKQDYNAGVTLAGRCFFVPGVCAPCAHPTATQQYF
jgi:hypothetical protein